jgi:hypothetical protein
VRQDQNQSFSIRYATVVLILSAACCAAQPIRANSPDDQSSICSLLSRADIEQALAVSVSDGREQVKTDALSICSFAVKPARSRSRSAATYGGIG